MPSSQVIQPAQQNQVPSKRQQQQSRGQLTSFLVIHDQQAGSSKPLRFKLTSTKYFNPPSVASPTGEVSQHNISRLSSFFGNLQSVMSYQQISTPQSFSSAGQTSTSRLSSKPHHLTTRTSAATSPASASSVVG